MAQSLSRPQYHLEEARLRVVRGLEILDTPAEEAFDRITRLTGSIFQTPITLISVIDRDRQWFKSRIGIDVSETPRSVAFCDHTIRQKTILCVPDATDDARFSSNPLVVGDMGLRFYAGAPLLTLTGHAIGTLCVADFETRSELTGIERQQLTDLAKLVVDELEWRVSRRAQAGLLSEAAPLRLFAEHSPEIIVRSNRAGIRSYVSPACRTVLGREPEELVGRAVMPMVHPDDWPRVAGMVDEVYRTGSDGHILYRTLHRDNRWVWLEGTVSLCRSPETQELELISVVRDVTLRVAAESKLRESELSFKLLFERNPVSMWVYDRETLRFLEVNAAAIKHYGYSREEFLAMTIAEIRPLEELERLTAIIRQIESCPLDHIVGVRHRRADGSIIDVEKIGQPLDYKGRPAELIAAFDITESARIQRELAAAKAGAEEASRAKSQFLANMSHELRTPLNAILGFSEIIREGCFGSVDPKRYRTYADHIYSSGRHLLAVITDILDLAKVEADKIELCEERVDLRQLVEASSSLVSQRVSERGLTLSVVVEPNLPLIYADELRLKQVIVNLLSNAVKFTDRGGQISVMAQSQPYGLVIAVADTGCGMPAESIPLALLPFGQVNADITLRRGGTGLGLPLAKRLTELHGGQLDVTSQEGVGTTVRVCLPKTRFADHALA